MLSTIFNVLGAIGSALGTLKLGGVNIGPIGNEALKVIDATEADHANFESGQAVVVGTFTENGVKGYIVAVKAGGPAASALGL